MTRREFMGCMLLVALVLAGRLVRHTLIVDEAGGWRDPGWLEVHLPEMAPIAEPARASRPTLPTVPLDPNTCPADSLCLLPGIGPALAERIIAAREQGVHFARARDLLVVRGIGLRTIERIEPYLTFTQIDSAR